MSTDISNIELNDIKTPWTNKKKIIAAVISGIIGVIIFAVSYFIAVSSNSVNKSFLDFIISIRQEDLTNYIKILTIFGSLSTAGILTISIALIWAFYKREFWRPSLLILSLLITGLTTFLFKSWYMIERPAVKFMIKPLETDYAFPSGHTIGIFVLVLVIGYLVCSRRSSPIRVFNWLATTLVLTAIMAFMRLYLGYHWITDTTASVGLGLVIFSLVVMLDKVITGKFTKLQ
jgi:undecaprenyl-diphosphatase